MIPSKAETSGAASELTDSAGSGNLDKVRDILFGGQMREVERRFARLEERLIKETQDLKEDETASRRASKRSRKESESLAEQLRGERERLESTRTLERRDTTLDEQLSAAARAAPADSRAASAPERRHPTEGR